jgi:hypothetical protein
VLGTVPGFEGVDERRSVKAALGSTKLFKPKTRSISRSAGSHGVLDPGP